jgi:hypothetical protein
MHPDSRCSATVPAKRQVRARRAVPPGLPPYPTPPTRRSGPLPPRSPRQHISPRHPPVPTPPASVRPGCFTNIRASSFRSSHHEVCILRSKTRQVPRFFSSFESPAGASLSCPQEAFLRTPFAHWVVAQRGREQAQARAPDYSASRPFSSHLVPVFVRPESRLN